jgi:hypothetical protein
VGSKCYVCGQDAGSVEDIIPTGIGGALRSRKLLCTEHNNWLGREVDAELCRQLLPLMNGLGVAPKSNTPDVPVTIPKKDVDGDSVEFIRSADGVLRPRLPKANVVEHDDGTATIHIEAGSLRHARQILNGYKRKYPKLDVDALMENLAVRTEDYYGPVRFQLDLLGGDRLFRAAAKVILGFALHRGVPRDQLQELISCVVGTADTSMVSPCYQVEYAAGSRRFDGHALVIRSEGKKLVGYVEFFGVLRFMVLLSNEYDGPIAEDTYGHSPLDDVVFRPHFGPLPEFVPNSELPEGDVRAAFVGFLDYLDKKTTTEVVDKAISCAMSRLGKPGDTLEVRDVVREMMNELEGTLLKRIPEHVLVPGSPPELPVSKHDPCGCGSGRVRRRCCFRT